MALHAARRVRRFEKRKNALLEYLFGRFGCQRGYQYREQTDERKARRHGKTSSTEVANLLSWTDLGLRLLDLLQDFVGLCLDGTFATAATNEDRLVFHHHLDGRSHRA